MHFLIIFLIILAVSLKIFKKVFEASDHKNEEQRAKNDRHSFASGNGGNHLKEANQQEVDVG